MKSKPTKKQIIVVNHAQGEMAHVIDLLNARYDWQAIGRFADSIEDVRRSGHGDVILCCDDGGNFGTTAVDLIERVQPGIPVIMLVENPDVDQVVDLMQIGVRAVVDWRNSERIVELINKEIAAIPVSAGNIALDVTEDKQYVQRLQAVHRELEAHRTHLYAILDTMQDAVQSISLPDWQVIFASSAFEEVFGYPQERFAEDADFFRQVVHPDDLDRAIEGMNKCLKEGFAEIDHRIIWPDGQVRWLHRRAWVNYDENGQPVRVHDTARDITQRKEIEAKLNRFKNVVSSTSDGISVVNRNYVYELVNAAYLERTALAREEIEGRHVAEIMGEDVFATALKPELDRCLAGETIRFADWFDYAGLGRRFISITYSPYRDDGGEIIGVVVNTRDITDYEQAKIEIEYHAGLLQQVSDAVIATDGDLNISAWNQAATEIYGWTEEEAVGQPIDQLLQTEWLIESQSLAQATVIKTGHWRGELRQTDKGGKQHYVVASVNILYNAQNEPVGGVTVNRDITSEKRREILQQRISFVMEAIAAGQKLPAILEHLAAAIEEYAPNIKASVLLLDSKTRQLRHGAAPSLPAAYSAAIDGTVIDSPAGSCGTAAFEKRLVIVEDIATDPLWKAHKDLALAHGLHACWSQPVTGQNDDVLGTFAMYYGEVRVPSDAELELIRLAARIAGLAIERAQAEAALRDSEEQFQKFMRYLPGAVFIKDDAERTVYCNDLYAAMSGAAPQEIIGKRSQDYMPAEVAPPFMRENELVLRENRAMEFHHTFPGADGLSHWLTIKFPIPRENESPLLGAISLDVTREKRAEASLKRSEERYRRMFDQVSLPKLITDPLTARILDANAAAVHFYGYSLETLQTMTMMQINVAEPEIILQKMNQILTGEISSCSFKQRLADGSVRDVEGFATGIELNEQQVLYCTYIDVTERNRAQVALQRINQQLERRVRERTRALEQARDHIQAIFNHSGDGILLLQADLTIAQSNHTLDQMFGLTDDSIFRRDVLALVTPADRATFETRLRDAIARHETQRLEIEALRDDKTTFAAEISIAPVNRSENPVENIVCIFRDVSARKQAEAERQAYLAEIADLYHNAPAGYHSLNRAGLFLQINDTELEWLGYTRAELIGKIRFVDLLAPASQETFRKMFPLLQQQGQISDVEFEMIHRDGSSVWVLGGANVVLDERGSFSRSRATLYNITELKQAQKAVAEERNLLRTVIDAIPNFVYFKNRENHIILNNVAHQKFLQRLGTEETEGGTYLEILPPDLVNKVRADEAMLFATGEAVSNIEDRIVYPDGEILWTETSKVPLRNLAGEIFGLVGITHDITRIKVNEEALRRSEQQLRESENMLQAVLDTIPVRVFWKDTDSVYLGCNHLFAQDAGLAQTGDVVGKQDTDFPFLHEQMLSYRRDDAYVMETGNPKLEYEETLTDVNGNSIILQTNKLPLRNSENEVVGVLGTYVDITERKQAEQQLRFLANLQAHMYDAVIATDLDFRIQSWNSAAERMFCWTAEDVMGRLLVDVLKTHILDGTSEEAQAELFTHGYWQGEAIQTHRNGSPVHVLASIVLNFDENGHPIGVIGVNHDITERKAAEENLRSVTERLQLAASAAQIGVWDWDIEGDRIVWDAQMYKIYGLDENDDIGPLEAMGQMHPDDVSWAQAIGEAALAGERPYDTEFRIVLPDGEIRYIRALGTVYRNDDVPYRMIGVNLDISEQKSAELALRASEEKFRMFIESAPIATIISDVRGQIVLVNKATEQLFGYKRDELSGASIQIFVPDERRDTHRLMMRDFMFTEHLQRSEAMELSARHKDGTVFPADIQLSLVDLSPAPLVMAFVMDITQRKQSEETLKLALQKEKELGELKSRFVSMASHQFRTPLAAILANTETLAVYRKRMEDSQIDTRLDRIRKQVSYMKSIMENVLELAHIQAKQVHYQPVESDLDALCQKIVGDFEQQERYQNRIKYDGPGTGLTAEFDYHLMHHLVSNLIQNALKYSADDQSVYVQLTRAGREITLKVTDRGIGIPTDDLNHLFEPFFRGGNVGAVAGTGLGLAIVKQAVDAHGGAIHVESAPEIGTTFSFTFQQGKG